MASATSGRTPRVSTSYLKIKMAMLREVMMGSDLGREGKKKKIKALLCLGRKFLKTDSGMSTEGSNGSENRGFKRKDYY